MLPAPRAAAGERYCGAQALPPVGRIGFGDLRRDDQVEILGVQRRAPKSQRVRDSAVIISSTMPSAKYSCSGFFVEALGHARVPFLGYRPDHRAGVELATIDASSIFLDTPLLPQSGSHSLCEIEIDHDAAVLQFAEAIRFRDRFLKFGVRNRCIHGSAQSLPVWIPNRQIQFGLHLRRQGKLLGDQSQKGYPEPRPT